MTARERQTSGGPGTALADIRREQATPFPLLSAMLGPAAVEPDLCRDDLCSCALSTVQKHLIELALRQGLLLECPVPPCPPAPPLTANPTESSRFQLLSQLVHGKTGALESFQPRGLNFVDGELDEWQKDAVAKALCTPDMCLIQGSPGTGKTRVAAEIITQAAARGQRVLLLAHSAAAIDRVLEMLAGREQIYGLRCLGRDEPLDRLPAQAQALTFAERSRILRQRTLESARRTQLETEQRLLRHAPEKALWPRLLELCTHQGQRQEELTRLQRLAEQLPVEVERQIQAIVTKLGYVEPSTDATVHSMHLAENQTLGEQFLLQLAEQYQSSQRHKTNRAETRQRLTEQRHAAAEKLAVLNAAADVLRPLAVAKQHGQWWKPSWWKAAFGGNSVAQFQSQQAESQAVQSELDQLDRELAGVEAEEETSRRQLTEHVDRLKQQHLAEQQEVLQQQIRVVQEKVQALTQDWQALVGQLPHEDLRPTEPHVEAVTAARQRWEQFCAQEEEKAKFLNQWLGYVEEFSATLASRLPRLANVVAATVRSLHDDEHFGDPQGEQHFDLLVLDEAHLIPEIDMFKVARRANRWVLIGEPAWEEPPRETPHEKPPPGRAVHPSRHAPARTNRTLPQGCFRKLWTHLHCDPSLSPYDWFQAGERLCCRLRPIPGPWTDFADVESVADRPDVELRIVTPPREMPFLAEVLFPAATPLHEAKLYIYQELQEVAVRTRLHQLLWQERDGRLVLPLTDLVPADTIAVPLAEGVTERLGMFPAAGTQTKTAPLARTVALEFAVDRGWTLESAREWVAKHLGWRDLGRTALLENLHRMSQPLAAVLHKLLYEKGRRANENGYHPTAPEKQAASAAPVEFIPVPALPDKRNSRRREDSHGSARPTPTGSLPIGGAGLEVEMAPGKAPATLPDELRGLPTQGVVNFSEAQAVIRKLEELVRDPLLQQTAHANRPGPTCPAIAVVALYPAQVELIRRLVHKSAKLSAGQIPIEIGLPAAFRHRECLVCVVSLTRSQGPRAVPYGDSCESLPLALTRARQRVILLGDAGQLARRSQWRGPLDHLDEAAAALEKRWVDQLVKHLQSQGQ